MLSLFCVHGRSVGLHFIGTVENVFHDPCHHKSHLLSHTTQPKSANLHERKNRYTYVSNHRLEWLVCDLLSACVTDKILSVSHMFEYRLLYCNPWSVSSMATLRKEITVHMPLASPAAHSLGERETFLALGIIQQRSNNTLISYKGAAQCLLRFYFYLTAESPTMYIQ